MNAFIPVNLVASFGIEFVKLITMKNSQGIKMSNYELNEKIEDIFDRMLRPAIAMDGGVLELVQVQESKVKIAMKGACGTCPSSLITLKNSIEATLRAELNLPNLNVENVNQSETSSIVLGWG